MEWVSIMNDTKPNVPPGSPPTMEFKGAWFSTQLTLSLAIGVSSFLIFCFLRTRWEVVYMGRTKLKDFSPTPAHSPDTQTSEASRFFGWIIPTLRTSEYTVLQTVGLDAAVLLNFFRMSFMMFSLFAFLAAVVLMPINLFKNGSTGSEPDTPSNDTRTNDTMLYFLPSSNTTVPYRPTLYEFILDPQTSATLHLVFTYVFTLLCLAFFHRNFHRFIFSRQNFALHLIHSVSARTVLVTNVPSHLRGDKALADYFEGCGWTVESVSVCREVQPLKRLLEKRTTALLALEHAWTDWVGNPANVQGYDPGVYSSGKQSLTASPQPNEEPLIPDLDDQEDTEAQATQSTNTIHTTRPRPTMRPRYFGNKVDAIEFWEEKYLKADEQVKNMRKKGRFDATHVAFVTFEDVKSAVVHYPHHSQVTTEPAPEPRDVVWSKISMPKRESQLRDVFIMGVMTVLLFTWIPPVSALATLLNYQEIKDVLPWLARIIDSSPRLAALVQNSIPSIGLISFNGLLPFLLEFLSYEQGFRSRSATEYSLMRKYYLFLLISVLFIFLLTSTYWALVLDLADTPMKLAKALQASNARNFMISYVMLQAIGLMPFQLLNIGPLLSLGYSRLFYTKTPRDFAEAYAPPMLNYGWVYPQALLIFTVTLVYSVVSPLILVFGAMYFGLGYLVFKYKLLFIYFKPYESNGEAWRITFSRLLWGLLLFQVFMSGLFSLRGNFWLAIAMIPLILYTVWSSWVLFKDFGPLSTYLALSSVCEVQRGEGADQVVGVRDEDAVSRSQSNLNHRRYAVNDETLYVAPSDKRTDYSQPPMNNFYFGVLNTGRRRYAHPALSGSLPAPWLPSKAKPAAFGDNAASRRSVVLSLRRKMGKKLGRSNSNAREDSLGVPDGWRTGESTSRRSSQGAQGMSSSNLSTSSNPWRDPTPSPAPTGALHKRLSFDPASGVIALPDEHVWDDDGSDNEGVVAESPSTYYHHPERSRSTVDNLLGNGAGTSSEPVLPQ